MTHEPQPSPRRSCRLAEFLNSAKASPPVSAWTVPPVIGIIEGAGIGPEIVGAALRVLAAVEKVLDLQFELRHGGPVGEIAEAHTGRSLPDAALTFCTAIFDAGGSEHPGCGASSEELRPPARERRRRGAAPFAWRRGCHLDLE